MPLLAETGGFGGFADPAFWAAALGIVLLDLVLAGDNAVVIALAAREVPVHGRKRVIYVGTLLAVILRILFAFLAVALLRLPALRAVGGVLLVWIAYRFLRHEVERRAKRAGGKHAKAAGEVAPADGRSERAAIGTAAAAIAARTMAQAVRRIAFADTIMSLDNVLAVAAVARSEPILLVVGLALSVPLMIWGSTFIAGLMDRFPVLVDAGGAVLLWSAAHMILEDPLTGPWFTASWVRGGFVLLVLAGTFFFAYLPRIRKKG
ncbi:TerC family protein [Brockia lithotrophica]|uniref:YjbE family integral membrane protein n=1 Tax=Brockia lithotrophica TaxID=933949 RepID=A0A660LA18_9BACL|nr:TerC family protein [Brockia lithotrophica]RKQ88410.1 YjbE family integral membrane protein [Brockia lithotrophica]